MEQPYTNSKKAFEDLKELFLNIIVGQNNPDQAEGWTQATAIQTLKKMGDKEILSLANSPFIPMFTLLDLAKAQEIENNRYDKAEPNFCDSDEHIERLKSKRHTLKYNKSVLNNMSKEDHIKYNRAFQMMHEHIESKFNRPLVSVNAVQLRQDMLNGLGLANPIELIKILDNPILKTDKEKYLDSIADSFVYVAKETRAERTEESAHKNAAFAAEAGATALMAGTCSVLVSTKEKDTPKEQSLATGLGLSAIVLGLVALGQLLKQSRKFGQALEQYAQVTNKILQNSQLRHNYYTFKTPKETYSSKTFTR